jgi:hypothetical protein
MKKIVFLICVFVCVAAALPAQARKGGTMYVAVKTVELKSAAGFFASAKGNLAYGAAVTVLQIDDKWAEVKSVASPSLSGWVSIANLSAKRVVSNTSTGATAQEVALAGKGFNQEIENAYKAGGKLNYADVDRTEAQRVSSRELRDFISEGRLFMGGK